VVRTVASHAEHAYEMDPLELHRTSIMLAALALTTDRSMFPKDLMAELQNGSRTDRTRSTRQRDHIGWLKSLDGCGPVTEVLTLGSRRARDICLKT